MSQFEFTRFFNPEFSSLSGITRFPFDIGAVMEAQRKNIEALSEARSLALEGIQAAAQRQTEILSRMVQDNSAMAREMMSEQSPERKIARQADLLQKNYERSMDTLRELSDMLSKSSFLASDVIAQRVSASLTELKSALEQTEKQTASRRKAA